MLVSRVVLNAYVATDGTQAAGLTFVQVPIGYQTSPRKVRILSPLVVPLWNDERRMGADYNLDDIRGDTGLNKFSVTNTSSYVFSVLRDIQVINVDSRAFT